MVTESFDQPQFDDPYAFELPEEPDEPITAPWRRPVLIAIAAITAIAMALIPLYNLLAGPPRVSSGGLEVCGFDYCVVQDAAHAAGIGDTMSRLANDYLSDEEAGRLATSLLEALDEGEVSFVVVERLDGALKGQYDPSSRTIYVERPVRAWIVVHEVAHARATGHGEEFQETLIELVRGLGNREA